MLRYYADACLSLLSTGGKQQGRCQRYFLVLCLSWKGECALVCRSSIPNPAFCLRPAIIFRAVYKSLWQMPCTRQADPARFAVRGVGVYKLLRLQSTATSHRLHLLSPVCTICCIPSYPLLFRPGQNAIFVFCKALLLLLLLLFALIREN